MSGSSGPGPTTPGLWERLKTSVMDGIHHSFDKREALRDAERLQFGQHIDGLTSGAIQDPKAPPGRFLTRRKTLIGLGLAAGVAAEEYARRNGYFGSPDTLAAKQNESRSDFTDRLNTQIDKYDYARVYDTGGRSHFEIHKDGDVYSLYRLKPDGKTRMDTEPLFQGDAYLVSATAGFLTEDPNHSLSKYATSPQTGAPFKAYMDKMLSEKTASATPADPAARIARGAAMHMNA